MGSRLNRGHQDIMIEYKVVSIQDVVITEKDLVAAHWAEVSQDQKGATLRIDDSLYIDLEEDGYLSVTAAYDGSNMVGYCVFLLNQSLHSGDLQATNDCIYVKPTHRQHGIAQGLMSFTEKDLVVQGVKYIGISMKSYAPFEGLVTSLGYELTELHYSKSVGR